MKLRVATPTDIDLLADFNCKMALETEAKTLDLETVTQGVRAVLEDPQKGFYLLAEEAGEVIGSLLITYEWSDWRNAPMWWFQSVFVVESQRGQGIFSKMYHHIKKMAIEAGAKELRLYVDKDNVKAQKVYEKLGMAETHYFMYEISLGDK